MMEKPIEIERVFKIIIIIFQKRNKVGKKMKEKCLPVFVPLPASAGTFDVLLLYLSIIHTRKKEILIS